MPALPDQLGLAPPWAGVALLLMILLANTPGVVDQGVARLELESAGVRPLRAPLEADTGRVVQLIGAPCLFVPATQPYAALALTHFLVGAACAVHPFWKAVAHDLDKRLVNFLKNTAIIGGLLMAAGWRR